MVFRVLSTHHLRIPARSARQIRALYCRYPPHLLRAFGMALAIGTAGRLNSILIFGLLRIYSLP